MPDSNQESPARAELLPVLIERSGKMHMVGEDGRCECGSDEPVTDGQWHPSWAGIFCVACDFPVVYAASEEKSE